MLGVLPTCSKKKLAGHIGTRSKLMGREIAEQLMAKGFSNKEAQDWAGQIAGTFGKLKKETIDIEQVMHFSPEEQAAIDALVAKLVAGQTVEDDEIKALLQTKHRAADIAMFGRMLAHRQECNTEAAAQVAHAITVHRVTVENDFFTAVDDLSRSEESGSAHMGDAYFGGSFLPLSVYRYAIAVGEFARGCVTG